MIVYWDLILLANIFINFTFLLLIETLHKEQIKYHRLILASFIGGGMVFSYLLWYQLFLIIKICGGILIGLVGFYRNSLAKIIIKISSFYIVNLTFIGILCSFKISNFVILLIGLVFLLVLVLLDANKRYYYFLKEQQYKVIIYFDDIVLKLKGYLDTGNFALSSDNEPIIFINQTFYKPKLLSYTTCYLETVNGKQLVTLYRPNKCLIYHNKRYIEKKVMVSFSNLHSNFECLLNVNLFI
ncbi:MAG: hypothetical protein GX203_04550 [Acholeplasmataceae bacterium]|nr:hypothetical protein [Acholeplasmataceae bacterium]